MGDSEGSTSNPPSATTVRTPYAPFPRIKPPPPLSLSSCTPKEWKLWKQLWLNYAVVANLTARYSCVQSERKLWRSTTPSSTKLTKTPVRSRQSSKFDEYFTGDISETYERFKFNQRGQRTCKSFDSYVTELRNMLKTCNFCSCLTDSLPHDQIVFGIKDGHTRKRPSATRKKPGPEKKLDICKS